MGITLYADKKRSPVGHWEDPMGHHLYSRPLTPFETSKWIKDFPNYIGPGIHEGGKSPSTSAGTTHEEVCTTQENDRSTTGAHVELWTTQEEDRAPSIAYLVGPNLSASALVPCLRIRIEVKQDDLNLKGTAISKPIVHLEIGYCNHRLLDECPAKISAKQTARQDWLSAIWKKVQFRLRKKGRGHQDEGAFTLIERLRSDAIEKQNTVRLIMMMYSEFWERERHPDEAKKSDVDAFGLALPSSRSAFGSKLRRMEFKISCKR